MMLSEEQMKLHVWTPESVQADCQEKHLKLFPFMVLKAMVLMWRQKQCQDDTKAVGCELL